VRRLELAVVGVRAGNRNTLLQTVNWGFDVVRVGGSIELRAAAVTVGPTGGSALMRRVLAREARAGAFPGHCFVGRGFPPSVRCPP
jgi:hypothetical protein